jgi:hypothetical protein
MLATLPGLPMFGHGQIEGFSEQYGMEFRRPQRDERPNDGLVERHRREIFPLLLQRWRFAGAAHFRQLTAFDAGSEVPDVFAYANRAEHGPTDAREHRSLVVYLNRYPRAHVRIPGTAEALGLLGGPGDFAILHDARGGLQYLRDARDLREHGLELVLDGYACHVFLGFEMVSDAAGAGWAELAMRLGLGGVPDAHLALRRMREEPLRAAVAAVLTTELVRETFVAEPGAPPPRPTPAEAGLAAPSPGTEEALREALAGLATAAGRQPAPSGPPWADVAARFGRLAMPISELRPRLISQAVAGWLVTSAIGEVACGGDAEETLRAFDDWEVAAGIDDLARRAGSSDGQAWRAVELARALLAVPPGALADAVAGDGLPQPWFEHAAVRSATGWNEWQGATYISQEAWHELLEALAARDALAGRAGAVSASAELQRRAKSVGYRLSGAHVEVTEGSGS